MFHDEDSYDDGFYEGFHDAELIKNKEIERLKNLPLFDSEPKLIGPQRFRQLKNWAIWLASL